MSEERTFVVVPFRRVGSYIGPQQMMVCSEAAVAKALADKLSREFPGVALIAKATDEDTGENVATVIAQTGAVPEGIAHSTNWTMPLH